MLLLVGEGGLGGTNVLQGAGVLFLLRQQPRRSQSRTRVGLGILLRGVAESPLEKVGSLPVPPYTRQQEHLDSEVGRLFLERFVVTAKPREREAPPQNRMIEVRLDGECPRVRLERFVRHAVGEVPFAQTVPGIRLAGRAIRQSLKLFDRLIRTRRIPAMSTRTRC